MKPIVAIDEAVVPFTPEAVARVLADVHRYGEWWPKPFRFDSPGGPTRVGSRTRMSNGPMGTWTATVTGLDQDRITLAFGDGAWSGTARWSVRPVIEGAAVVYRVDASPTGLAQKAMALATDIRKHHTKQMRYVFEALDQRLRALGETLVPAPTGPPAASK